MYAFAEIGRGIMQGLSLALLCASIALYCWTFLVHDGSTLQSWMRIALLASWLLMLPTGFHQWRSYGWAPNSFSLRAKLQGYPEWFAQALPLLILMLVLHAMALVLQSGTSTRAAADHYISQPDAEFATLRSDQKPRKMQVAFSRVASILAFTSALDAVAYWWVGAGSGRSKDTLIQFEEI